MTTESAVTDEQIVEFLNDPPQAGSSTGGNLTALIVSLLIFAGAGLFEWSIPELATLVLVIFLHEGGHLLAMKLFGYKDLRMLFLPFLGAIASGRTGTNLSYQQAVVSLAGPVPGIAIGSFLLFAGLSTGIDWLFFAANLFLFLNLFNMLPIFPLDGG
ncbi:MAG: hypothetical protein OEV30_10550, partial [Ignavibacteria bacterium]|nr:hypothetical protein [Ignavibacteria bacterium]